MLDSVGWVGTYFLHFSPFLEKNHVYPLDDLISFLDPLINARTHGAEVTRVGAIVYGAEQWDALASAPTLADDVAYLGTTDLGAKIGNKEHHVGFLFPRCFIYPVPTSRRRHRVPRRSLSSSRLSLCPSSLPAARIRLRRPSPPIVMSPPRS